MGLLVTSDERKTSLTSVKNATILEKRSTAQNNLSTKISPISVVSRRLRDERGGKRFSHTRLGVWTRVRGDSQVM